MNFEGRIFLNLIVVFLTPHSFNCSMERYFTKPVQESRDENRGGENETFWELHMRLLLLKSITAQISYQ